MTSFLDKLNLRPHERRLVVIVAIVVFAALNVWLVWPHFGDVARWQLRKSDAEKKLKTFSDEVGRKSRYEAELKKLESQGLFVGSEEQALRFQQDVTSQSALSGVLIQRIDPAPRSSGGRTNAFFEEQTLVISVNTGEKELVDFLYNLGARNSLIRVRSMALSPDPTRMRLNGSITLVQSFQKKKAAPPKTAAPAKPAATTNAAPKSAPAPAKATNTPPKSTALPKRNVPSSAAAK